MACVGSLPFHKNAKKIHPYAGIQAHLHRMYDNCNKLRLPISISLCYLVARSRNVTSSGVYFSQASIINIAQRFQLTLSLSVQITQNVVAKFTKFTNGRRYELQIRGLQRNQILESFFLRKKICWLLKRWNFPKITEDVFDKSTSKNTN